MTEAWSARVLKAFGNSAAQYDASAELQADMASKLAGRCRNSPIPRGLWVDLGSGTGRLADAIEQQHPGQSVLRLDGSEAMLRTQRSTRPTLLHDLNEIAQSRALVDVEVSSPALLIPLQKCDAHTLITQ